MTKEELKMKVESVFPGLTFDETGEWLSITLEPNQWSEMAKQVKEKLGLDYLFCVSGVDWKTRLSVVYHLSDSRNRAINLVVKVSLADRENPTLITVSDIWRTAEFHELEVYDLFGVKFLNHPGLRRIFLTEDWKGWPLRKDYEDPINMIDL